MSYNNWLKNQEKLCYEVQQLIFNSKLKSKCLMNGKSPPTIRISLDGTFLDFRIKEITTSQTKTIWVAKVSDITPKINFFIHSKREGDWLYILADTILKKGSRRNSVFDNKTVAQYVVDRSFVKNIHGLIRSLKIKEEKLQQKTITKWME